MTIQDWRDASADDVRGLYDAERRRWQSALFWDPSAALVVLEDGRTAGHVPGWLARDVDGTVVGWTYFVLHDGLLHIGGLVAARPSVARSLLDAVLASPEASLARTWSGFLFPGSDGVASALTRQRFALRETAYLERLIDGAFGEPRAGALRNWSEEDFANSVRVLTAAYEGEPAAAAFAPDGRRDQWAQYAWQLLRSPGCGRFDARLSAAAIAVDGTLLGMAMATWIAEDTVHLAQLAVLPAARQRGTGEALVRAVGQRALGAGARRLTLMVNAGNDPAGRLYDRLGFRERARFLFASRAARNRVAA